MTRQKTKTLRKHISFRGNTYGGLVERKAEQGRFFCCVSTRTSINPFRFTYFYTNAVVGIDSS